MPPKPQTLQTNQQNPSPSLNNAVQWILNCCKQDLLSHSSHSHALRHKTPSPKSVLQEKVKLVNLNAGPGNFKTELCHLTDFGVTLVADEGSKVPILTFQLPAGNALSLTFPQWLLNYPGESNQHKHTQVSNFSLPHTHTLYLTPFTAS